ncbi:MAG: prepilin-type N-terminal cleavage/methylation domain-containing protein [Deltaproteobacteria bacterium]|nr:prepilin-type N-terminal cleavage/methylation domain-containing protein [Deltaproteobacteria bacterium]
MREEKGFTLIEIMIAILIVGFMAMLMGDATRRSFEVRDRLHDKAELFHNVRTLQFLLSRDIRLAYNLPEEKKREEEKEKQPPRFSPLFKGGKNRVLFSTTSHRRLYEEATESELAIVEYRLETSEEDLELKQVVKREKVFFDEDPDRGGDEYPVADQLIDLSLKYYDKENDQWSETWDSTGGTQIGKFPDAVSFEVKYFEKKKKGEKAISTVVRLEVPNLELPKTEEGVPGGGGAPPKEDQKPKEPPQEE